MYMRKLKLYDNLFIDLNCDTLYRSVGGEMVKVKTADKILLNEYDDFEKELSDFEKRLLEMDEKVENGTIECNLDSPEDCGACGS